MKTILCYGDSLTHGAIPGGGRHDYEDRWPSVLEDTLGRDKVRVVAEGLGGRTTALDDYTAAADRNGARILPTILGTHQPIDCLVLMLGTNDIKTFLSGDAVSSAAGMKRLVEMVRTYPFPDHADVPKIVLVAPPHCIDTEPSGLQPMFGRAPGESRMFAERYKQVAKEIDCLFFDASTVAVASPIDGVHLDAKNTRAIGSGVAPIVAEALGL